MNSVIRLNNSKVIVSIITFTLATCLGRNYTNIVQDVEEEGKINGESTNRGNKLKFGSAKVHRDRINGYNNDNDPLEVIHYNRSKRSVVKKRRIDTYNYNYNPDASSTLSGTNIDVYECQGEQDEDDPYAQIDIEKILSPVTHPSDVVTRPSIARTYKSNVMKHLAQQAIETIEKEQNTVIQLSKLFDILLGEDSSQLLENELHLPEYDHNLVDKKLDKTSHNGKDHQDESSNTATDFDKRVTRRQSTQEVDPFFALPTMKIDTNFGLSPEVADEARQLSQISLQRSEEFIRNLTSLRNGLARAQTLKEKLYQWGREINGDPDESDIYQAEKEAAAKAAAEAGTANQSGASGSNTNNAGSGASSVAGTATPEVRNSNGRGRRV